MHRVKHKMDCIMIGKNKNSNGEKLRELTRAEMEVMLVLWAKERALTKDILDEMPEPKPAYNTVSTIIRILETKGFVGHKAYGHTHEYYPLVSKHDYTNSYMSNVLDNFCEGSLSQLVNFFTAQKSVSVKEADEIMKLLNQSDNQ